MNSQSQSQSQVKKSLPAKHNQHLVFTYWMLNQMKSDGTLSDESFQKCLEKFHVFDNIEIQKEYFDHYFEDFKLIQKNLKQEVKVKNKKPKMKKEKVVDTNEPVKKRGRKRKVVHDNRSPEEILIDEIVRKCNEPNIESEPPNVSEPEPEPEKKRGRPRKIKKITSIVADGDIMRHLISESERSTTEELEQEDSDEEQEIEVRKIVLHNKTYLIDDNDTIYDLENHDELGKYDKKTLEIVYDN